MEPARVKHRVYAYLNNRQFKALSEAAGEGRGAFAQFVREAVEEKLDRDKALRSVSQARDELSSLLEEMRLEFGQTRKDLVEDNQRGLERIRMDVGKSMRKSEEMQKTFILMLGQHVSSQPSKPKSRRDDDGPMPIPS